LVTDRPPTGRTLATRRAIVDVVRSAVLSSYGVTGLAASGLTARLLARLRLREPGIRVRLDRGLEIDLFVSVGYGLPIAEVARQIDSAVRYGVRRAFDREVRRLTVHVGGLRYQPATVPPTKEPPPSARVAALAAPEAEAGEGSAPGAPGGASGHGGHSGPVAGPGDGQNGSGEPLTADAIVSPGLRGRRSRRTEDAG
jgi:uncharacterized alkaline shock family protein YloU